tara:strand:- start:299 stop:517 length:219 start_codon:yes stop_codon:yes gene_type:complete
MRVFDIEAMVEEMIVQGETVFWFVECEFRGRTFMGSGGSMEDALEEMMSNMDSFVGDNERVDLKVRRKVTLF